MEWLPKITRKSSMVSPSHLALLDALQLLGELTFLVIRLEDSRCFNPLPFPQQGANYF
jgi:hypothetical protein